MGSVLEKVVLFFLYIYIVIDLIKTAVEKTLPAYDNANTSK
jgi:hypothetical protein